MSSPTFGRRGPKKTGIKFGPRLREVAREQRVSQAELARLAQVDVSTINRLFKGELGCNDDIAAIIACRLAVSLEEIRHFPAV